ncbi:MAG: hypothetical protein ACTTJ3_05530, partial [Treponema sp.]
MSKFNDQTDDISEMNAGVESSLFPETENEKKVVVRPTRARRASADTKEPRVAKRVSVHERRSISSKDNEDVQDNSRQDEKLVINDLTK